MFWKSKFEERAERMQRLTEKLEEAIKPNEQEQALLFLDNLDLLSAVFEIRKAALSQRQEASATFANIKFLGGQLEIKYSFDAKSIEPVTIDDQQPDKL